MKHFLLILLFITAQSGTCEQGIAWSNNFSLVDQENSLKYSAFAPGDREFRAVPNPFKNSVRIILPMNASTTLSMTNVKLEILNIAGRIIRATSDVRRGTYIWDGRDTYGRPLSSGIYIVRLSVDGKIENRNVLLLK